MRRRFHLVILLTLALTIFPIGAAYATPTETQTLPPGPNADYARNVAPMGPGVQEVNEAVTASKVREANGGNDSIQGTNSIQTLWADGRVYNVTSAVNVRACPYPGPSCPVYAVAYAGADLENDASGGLQSGGYQWLKVVYAYGSSDPCSDANPSYGWVIVDPLQAGNIHVLDGPLNVREYPWCSSTAVSSLSTGATVPFFQDDSQWSGKWYEIPDPSPQLGDSAFIQGWDFADVY